MLSYRLGTVNDFQWVFKPVLSYSKPPIISTFLEKKKKDNRTQGALGRSPEEKVKVKPFTEDH